MASQPLRLLMLNDNREHPNWGAQATPAAIDAVLSAKLPGCERTWLSWYWLRSQYRALRWPFQPGAYEPGKTSGIRRRLAHRFSAPIDFFPAVADDFDRFADEWMEGRGGPMATRFLDEMERADALVYNGENSLYRNTLEGTRALFLLWLSKTRLGKPTCIVNHTVHLTSVLPVMNAMVRKVHPALDLVTCRESASHRLLQEFGIAGAALVPDAVFWLREETAASTRVETWLAAHRLSPGAFVCLSSSGLPVSRPRGEWDGAFAQLVRKVAAATGLPTVLLARDPRRQFLEEVARRTGSAYFGPEHHYTDLWPLLRHAAALVTGHYHYAIIGSIGGCPYVPLSANNHKMAGLNEMLAWPPVEPFDATDLASCGDAVAARAAELGRTKARHASGLAARADALRTRVGELPLQILHAVETRR